MPASVTEHHHARERRETDEQIAEAIISARLKKLGWGKRELATRRKGDPEKVALARDLRSQTTMSLKWIARRLEMGSWTHVSNLLLGNKWIALMSKVRTDPRPRSLNLNWQFGVATFVLDGLARFFQNRRRQTDSNQAEAFPR